MIFDLDGTLTEPVLDFDAIRAEIGLPPGRPILEQLERLERGASGRAPRRSCCGHERDAIARATLSDGCADLLGHLRRAGDPDGDPDPQRARGGRDASRARFAFQFHAVYTREDGPPKPSPAGVLRALRAASASPPRTPWPSATTSST